MLAKTRAVLDIGSNTVRLLIAEVSPAHKILRRVHYQHHIVRLGEGLQQTGHLSELGQQRALVVFATLVQVCASFGIKAADIYAVATAAIRESSNGQAFVAQVLATTGLNIHIISGESEAHFALLGAQSVLKPELNQDMLLFDIGGGSTEFSRVSQGKLVDSISEKMGVVRMKELFLQSNPTSVSDYTKMKQHAVACLQRVEASWAQDQVLPRHLVGTAGTVTTLVAIHQNLETYDVNCINNYSLSREDFLQLRDNLLKMTHAERLAIPALEKGREDVIVAGLAIVDVLFEHWGFKALVSVDAGLLEGLLLVATKKSERAF